MKIPLPLTSACPKGKGSHKRESDHVAMLAGNAMIDDSGKERMMDDRGK